MENEELDFWIDDLLRKDERTMAETDGRDWIPEDILTDGRRVILNPTSAHYDMLKSSANGSDAGYVYNQNASDTDVEIIASRNTKHMPGWTVNVTFDNGIKQSIKMRDLLPVDAPFKPIMLYKVSSETPKRYFKGEEDKKYLDKKIINEGRIITEIVEHSEEYYQNIVKMAYNRIKREND